MDSASAMLQKSRSGLTPPIPQTSLRRPEKAMNFNDWHVAKSEWISQDNRVEQFARWRKWSECLNFFVGLQLIWWNGNMENGYWKNAELEEGDPYYASNIYQPYINAVIAELYRSNPKLIVNAKTDQWRQIEGAVIAKHALEQDQARLWTEEQKLRYLFFYVLYGNAFTYLTWVQEGGPKIKIPQYEQQSSMMDSRFGVCPRCGMQQDLSGFGASMGASTGAGMQSAAPSMPASTPADMPIIPPPPMCPKCQSPMQIMGNQSNAQVTSYGGEQERDGGDTALVIPDPMQIKMHVSSRSIFESPYLSISSWHLIDAARMIYGENIDFQSSSGKEQETQRSFIRQAEAMAGNMTGMGAWGTHDYSMAKNSSPDKDLTMIRQDWLRPSQYWHVILDKPLETEKYQIPAGTALREVFPKGMVLTKNNHTLLDLDDREINKHWTHARFQPMGTKIWGDSIAEQLVQGSREYNEMRSIELENYAHNATPATVVNPKKIKPTNLSGKARQVISMENTSKGDDNPANYIYTPQARQLGGDIPNFKQGIKGDMQLISGAPVGESGIAGSSSDTATGMQILRDWTNNKMAIRLGPRNAAYKLQGQQNLELIQKHWIGNRYIKISNEIGLDDGKWFEGASIQGDYDIAIVPGSDKPVSSMELKDNLLQFLVAGGMPLGALNEAFPRQAAVILSRELGLPMNLDRFTEHARKQRDEIDDIKFMIEQVSQEMQQAMPPEMQAMQEQIDPMAQQAIAQQIQQQAMMAVMRSVPVEETDDDAAHIETITYYLNTDTGRKEPKEVKAAIIEHMHMHKQAQQMKQMQQFMMATGGGMFPMAGQQPMPNQAGQPQDQGAPGGSPANQQSGNGSSPPRPKPMKGN